MNSYYNIFVGTENGLLKGINSQTKTFNNLNNMDNLNKEQEIVSMCWVDNTKQDQICFATRDQHLVKYVTNHTIEEPFEILGQIDAGAGLIKGLDFITEDRFYTVVESGAIKVWLTNNDEKVPKLELELNAGANITCVKTSPFNTNKESYIIATGGKENDLKVWDLNSESKEPIFRAKNVPDNWMQLREAVWVMGIDFLTANKVATSTAYHQIRVYDIKSGIRRPSLNLTYGERPITSITALPDANRVIVGNTFGEMEMIDLRTYNSKNAAANAIKKYKSFQGTIKSIQINDKHVATCGLDRFLRVHDYETSVLASKVYLKSRLNCLLFSKHEPVKPATATNGKKVVDDDQLSNINSEDLGTDDLWSDMETIIEEHPVIKRKLTERLNEFESEPDTNQEGDDKVFKKPK